MSYYKAIANGNADTLSIWETWDGSAWVAAVSLPSTSDDVYTNNNIVTVTTSQSYNSWNRSSVETPYNITQGGQFQIDGGNDILISGDIYGTNVKQTYNSPLSACVNRLATHTGTISIIGNQNGGIAQDAYGFYNNAASTFTSIVGNQNGGSGNYAYGFYNNIANLNIPFQGNAYASVAAAAIYNNQSTTTIIYTGNIYNNLGLMAIRSDRLFLNVTPTTVWEFSDFGGDTQRLYGAGVNTGHPIEADVRKDTVYGPNDEFTGTLAVPPPESVVKNVPTDDTVGGLPIAQVVEEVDMELIKTKLQAIQEDTTNMPENVTTQLKQDVLGQRLSKVATLEELMGILTSLLK